MFSQLPSLGLTALVTTLAAAGGAAAAGTGANICDLAAEQAAAQTGVPLALLYTVARVEAGRPGPQGLTPWPWTINAEGQGHFFDSREEAIAFASDRIAEGRSSIDIGCFQINLRWHENAFADLEQMFDPEANALYAARFLDDLARQSGNWDEAVRAYHSRTPELAERYFARISEVALGLGLSPPADEAGHPPAPPMPVTRVRGSIDFPFFQPGEAMSQGSIVPFGRARAPLFKGAEG